MWELLCDILPNGDPRREACTNHLHEWSLLARPTIWTSQEHHPATLGLTLGLQVHPFVHACALYELRAPTQYSDAGSQRPQQCAGQQQCGTTLLILCRRRPLAAIRHRRLPLPGWHFVWISEKSHTAPSTHTNGMKHAHGEGTVSPSPSTPSRPWLISAPNTQIY